LEGTTVNIFIVEFSLHEKGVQNSTS
jgi:hypothetical protein